MNKIVRENYPVEKLPEDLRAGLSDALPVTVLLEQEEPEAARTGVPGGHFTKWKHLRRTEFASNDEIVAHVRALRDEWDRR